MRLRFPSCTALLAVSSLLAAGCDPGWGIDGTVAHDPAALADRALIVVVITEPQTDERGLPAPREGLVPGLAIAKMLDDTAVDTAFRFGTLGCADDVQVLAFVDADQSEDTDVLRERTLAGSEERTADHERIKALRPTAGDWVAASETYHFAHDGALCDPDHADVELEVQPLAP